MRADLDPALARPGISEAQLRKIGWGFPSARTAPGVPGQCRDFEVSHIAGRTVEFDWKKPAAGGKPSGYKLYRRLAGTTGDWILRDEEHDFPTGTWDVVVAATNAKGEGPVSNTATVTVA